MARALRVTVEVEGMEEVSGLLRKIGDRAADLRPAFRASVFLLRKLIGKEQFETRGRARGTPWAPLAPLTLMLRMRRAQYYRRPPGGPIGILRWTGELQRSFLSKRESRYHVESVRKQSLVWGSEHPLAAAHQWGLYAGPARPILAFRDEREVEELFVRPVELHVYSGLERGKIQALLEPRLSPKTGGVV